MFMNQVELKATQVELVGTCDVSEYPLQKKRHTLEFLRGIAHLRPRTNTIGGCLAKSVGAFFSAARPVQCHIIVFMIRLPV
jgi:aspartyl/asparaginyl-tRNA synthetase